MNKEQPFGSSSSFFIGHSTSQEDRYKASSGGIGTAIIKYLLSKPEYGTSITFVFDCKGCKYVPKMIHSSEELNICGSIYHDIDIAQFLAKHVQDIESGLVITCPPCQVTAIRQICRKNGINLFVISYCCSGQTTIEGTWKYYEFLGINKEDVTNMQYRGNGWPSGIQIQLKNGTKIYKGNYTEPWITIHQSWLYRPEKCFFCKRDTGRNADISLADPWIDEYKQNDTIGNTMIIITSDLGKSVLESMNTDKLVEYFYSNYDTYSIAQKPNIQKEIMVRIHKRYLLRARRLTRNKFYHKWATSSIRTMRIHIKILRMMKLTESPKSIISSIINFYKKIRSKLRRVYYSKQMNTQGLDFNIKGG